MRYDIKDIGEEGIDLDLELGATWLRDNLAELDPSADSPGLRMKGRLESIGNDYLLRGDIRGKLSIPCVRCLEHVDIDVSVSVAVSFVEKPDIAKVGAAAAEDSMDDGSGDIVAFADGVIDVAPQLREEILLSLPMNPGHDPECAGICSVCGNNRDTNPCDCLEKQQQAASPFAALANLKS